MSSESAARTGRLRRWMRPGSGGDASGGVLDAFAESIDLRKLNGAEFVHLLETLHMLGSAGAGVELSGLSTGVLVGMVHRASKEQLRALTEHSELRAVFLDEIFRRMSDQFVPERARNVNVVLSWRFSHGSGDDGFDRFQTVIEDGVCVSSTDLGRTPDTTITVAAEDFIRMATGVAAAATMLVTGRVRVKGEYTPAVRFSGYFDIPKP